jgi:hypothetical protein
MKYTNILLVSFLMIAVVTACTGFQVEVVVPPTPGVGTTVSGQALAVATSTPIATLNTQLPAETASPTPTSTSTPLPVVQPTNTPAPTSTPRLTSTPAATAQPTAEPTQQAPGSVEVDDSDQLLRLRDLPAGFQRIDPMEMGLSEEMLNSGPFRVESVFAFYQPESNELVGGGTTLLAGAFDRIGFDLLLGNPELIISLVLGNVSNVELSGLSDMALPTIGDKSVGLTVVAEVEGEPMRANLVIFRKGTTGVALAQLLPEGEEPTASIQDLVETMADRVQ